MKPATPFQVGSFFKQIMLLNNNYIKNSTPIINCYYYKVNFIRTRSFHTSPAILAGHSKWQNIRHIKGAKDLEKSQIFSRLIRNMKEAAKEGGSLNPKLNLKLLRVVEQAKQANMPQSVIENTLKRMEKSLDDAKPSSLVYGAPGGIFIITDILTDNIARTRSELTAIAKKANFKEQRGGVEGVFEEKGFIVAKGDIEKALDHAIEVGAEDVTEENGFLTFVCDPADFQMVKQGIEKQNYEVEYSAIDKIPYQLAVIKESDVSKVKLIHERLENHEEVMKLHCNYELN